jgi:hypothetical protein
MKTKKVTSIPPGAGQRGGSLMRPCKSWSAGHRLHGGRRRFDDAGPGVRRPRRWLNEHEHCSAIRSGAGGSGFVERTRVAGPRNL